MTLIEIMVVLVIMTAVASAVAVGVLRSWNDRGVRIGRLPVSILIQS
jgi:type II secretory pathway pseudopilin PulG